MTTSFASSDFQQALETPLGTLYLIASDRGLQGLYWRPPESRIIAAMGDPGESGEAVLREASGQIAEYLAGARQAFDLPLDLCGTPFQKKVWKALLDIPYGATVSYRVLADRIGSSGAARAVGSACGRNPVCLIVPCHRVVASAGGLGGYAGGLAAKEKLLTLEGAWIGSGHNPLRE